MKTLIAALAAVATVTAVAAPAAAQPYRGQDRYEARGAYNINAREADLQQRIDRGIRRGLLTRQEVADLNHSLRQFHRTEAAYRADGLTRRERATLDKQLDWLEARLEGRLGNAAYARR
jgi:hypothetical protein